MTCEAKQYSDQMSCGRCGLSWDMNDIDPPACGKDVRALDLGKALAALAKAGERTLGVTSRANETPLPKPGGPFSTAQALAAPQAEGVPVSATVVAGQPLERQRDGQRTHAEEWMRQAVERGEVVLERRPGRVDVLRINYQYCMPAELPDEAAHRMAVAVHGAPGYPGESEGMRTAYRELLAYLGQA